MEDAGHHDLGSVAGFAVDEKEPLAQNWYCRAGLSGVKPKRRRGIGVVPHRYFEFAVVVSMRLEQVAAEPAVVAAKMPQVDWDRRRLYSCQGAAVAVAAVAAEAVVGQLGAHSIIAIRNLLLTHQILEGGQLAGLPMPLVDSISLLEAHDASLGLKAMVWSRVGLAVVEASTIDSQVVGVPRLQPLHLGFVEFPAEMLDRWAMVDVLHPG